MRSVLAEIEAIEEPHTMARVEGLITELWPARVSFLTWIEDAEPRRNLVVFFGRRGPRVAFEGAGATWREAFTKVEQARLAAKKTAPTTSTGRSQQ